MKLANHVCLLTIFVLALPELTGCAIARAHKKSGSRVGEIVPLSARVAKKISEPIKLNQSPKKILEVGAGSGAMTPKIITKMTEQDHLDLVEIEPLLCAVLQEKFGGLKNVAIHCMDFLDWQPPYQYDAIVSTLPFNSFPPELVEKLVNHLIYVAKDQAYLGFVEFKWLPSLRQAFMNKKDKEVYVKTRKIIADFYNKYGTYYDNIYINFPPIIVYYLIIDKNK